MKTVIQVVQHLRPGGIEIIALDLASFAQADEKTIIISLEGDLKSAVAAWPKLKPFARQLIFLNKQPGLRPILVMQLLRIISKTGADAVHTHHIGPLLYAGLAARLAGVKHLIHTEHDAWHLKNSKRRFVQRCAVNLLRPILVADAQNVADNMRVFLQYKNEITIIRNGIDSKYFTPGNKIMARAFFSLPADVQLIGCSGRMEKVKGQSVLIHALSKLPLTVHLALAGSGSTETALRTLVDLLRLNNRVHFLGHIDNMPTFYQALDLFCLPSLNEGLPLSPLEAQSCNIAALVTDVGGAKETLCPDSGEFIAADDCTSMAETLLKMLHNPSNNKPRAFVKQHGDVRAMARSYAGLRGPLVTSGEYYE
ncbi:glycosyltransferase [Psychromonas ossibalaenae]|uniref:glycosyltransferase n=1 Tax=Psychromonas ossibalaenae TaxID=444922 RepID=UPI000375A125|nr:glycosyltransferase [Psychromonas ossibalaenae]